MCEETEVPVTPTTSNTLTTNASLVTNTGAMMNTGAMVSRVETRTQPRSLDVTSTTANTVLTTSLTTLNMETDGATISIEVSEEIPLLDSAEMQSQGLIITRASETNQSNRPIYRARPVTRSSSSFNNLQAALTKLLGSGSFNTINETLSRTTDGAERSRRSCTSKEFSTQTQDSYSQHPWMAADGSSVIEGISSPRLLAKMVEMERERHRLMNLTTPLTQREKLSWDNVQFIRDLIFRTNFCQQSNSSYIAERIRHLQCLTTWILQLLVCDAACVISFRRELENLLQSCLSIANHLADPDSHHDQETLLMKPFFSEPQSLDSETIEYVSFDPYVYKSRSSSPLDRHPRVSQISRNSTLGVPSQRDEEQFVWVDQGSENCHAYIRYGDPVYQRLYSMHREQIEANAHSSRRSDELDELTLAESETDRQEFHGVPRTRRSRVSERSPETRQSTVSVESLAAQLRDSRLRARSRGARNRARCNGYTDPLDDLVPRENLIGRVRSRSSPVIMSGPRPIKDWVSPLRLNDTVPTIVLPNGGYGYSVPNAHMSFADYENIGVRSDSFSSITDTSTVEMTSLDANSPRVAGLVQVQEVDVDGRDSLPTLVLPEFSTVPPFSLPFIHTASENFTSEISSTRGGSLGTREDAGEDRDVDREANPRSEKLQRSRTLSSPELVFHFSDGEELGLRRYSPNQLLYNSSSSDSSSQASLSPEVSTTAGLNSYVYDSKASTLPVQDQIVD